MGAKMAVTMCINPIYLTLPAGIVCSYAFALPVATAPNAIVFGHSSMKTTDMMKAGFLMNIVCLITVALSINTYAVPLFDLNSFPDWASSKLENASLCTPSHSPTLQSTTPTFSSPPQKGSSYRLSPNYPLAQTLNHPPVNDPIQSSSFSDFLSTESFLKLSPDPDSNLPPPHRLPQNPPTSLAALTTLKSLNSPLKHSPQCQLFNPQPGATFGVVMSRFVHVF